MVMLVSVVEATFINAYGDFDQLVGNSVDCSYNVFFGHKSDIANDGRSVNGGGEEESKEDEKEVEVHVGLVHV